MVHWARRNRLLLVASAVIIAVAVPVAVSTSRDTSADAEALVVAQRLDMEIEALPGYAETVFSNGAVARAVALSDGGPVAEVVPDRVSLITEPDSVVFRVIGHDPDPENAAHIANVAAAAFVETLNLPGSGVGVFALMTPAEPDVPAQPGADEADAGAAELSSIAISLGVGLAVGVAAGFALGRLSPARRNDPALGAAQDPLF